MGRRRLALAPMLTNKESCGSRLRRAQGKPLTGRKPIKAFLGRQMGNDRRRLAVVKAFFHHPKQVAFARHLHMNKARRVEPEG